MDFISLSVSVHWLLVIGIGIRVIMKRPEAGVALAWMLLVAVVPYGGALVYLLIGERRIDPRREREIKALQQDYRRLFDTAREQGITDVDWLSHSPAAKQLDTLGGNLVGSHAVGGSAFQLKSDTAEVLATLASEIDAAKTSVLMEFYIWAEGGAADTVLEALIMAAGRGVSCRVLVDAIGARPWWKGDQPARLRAAGVEVRPALPVGLFRSFVGRTDLRLHRKIVVIDGEIAWTGSMNLVDPRFFKADAGVGEWVDAMVRVEGPIVGPLAAIAIGDWRLETNEPIADLVKSAGLRLNPARGTTDMQAIPSGPGQSVDGLLQMMLALIAAAREELVVTTPYLVPDASLLRALRGAAGRGVAVSIIVPERVDSILTRYASRSYFEDLLDAGVAIHLYRDGLLHTKSIVADSKMAMFGTANIDMRSIWLNYEDVLFVYDPAFSTELRALQATYIEASDPLLPGDWADRATTERFTENAARLISPLL
ncbi:cardiolipin synthase [Bauldia litoralis]|uniref:Cardiolipin synthase n=1 Tax=Bauldia litoralis TaxID=665467 RepID=A0A1G6CDI9_9HYPH|nr:cardiolipin synthase [Bauldia litoralis]SDB30960.1 cardiolipin synthase [Bauldia litoralis]